LYSHADLDELAKVTNEKQIQESKIIELLQKIEELESQIASLSDASGPSKEDIEEAMMLLRLKRETGMTFEYISGIQNIEDDNKALKELRVQFAECVQELEKTKMMLKLQQNINKTSDEKLKKVSDQSRKIQHEYELRIEEYVRLNDLRKHKIEKLQQQLRNIGVQEGLFKTYK
jgi:protein fantom